MRPNTWAGTGWVTSDMPFLMPPMALEGLRRDQDDESRITSCMAKRMV